MKREVDQEDEYESGTSGADFDPEFDKDLMAAQELVNIKSEEEQCKEGMKDDKAKKVAAANIMLCTP